VAHLHGQICLTELLPSVCGELATGRHSLPVEDTVCQWKTVCRRLCCAAELETSVRVGRESALCKALQTSAHAKPMRRSRFVAHCKSHTATCRLQVGAPQASLSSSLRLTALGLQLSLTLGLHFCSPPINSARMSRPFSFTPNRRPPNATTRQLGA